jgi:aminopeptidase
LDKENPIEAWLKVMGEQTKFLSDYLEGAKNIRIVDENESTETDLTMSVEGHLWRPSYGRLNLPDNEIGNAPRKTSVNGHFKTEIPQAYRGWREIRGLSLNLKNGEVKDWDVEKGSKYERKMKDFLDRFFDIPGTRYLGEVSLGMNPNIDKITKQLFVDEKMGGSIHIALGWGWLVHVPEGKDRSQLHDESTEHWDIIKDMRGPGRYIEIERERDKKVEKYNLTWDNITRQWMATLYS